MVLCLLWTVLALAPSGVRAVNAGLCPGFLSVHPFTRAEFADMHDGDVKLVSVEDGLMTIRPASESETWIVSGKWNSTICGALVDFSVLGKKDPPPVPLLATLWLTEASTRVPGVWEVYNFEFTDPSETIAPRTQPLNRWVRTGFSEKPRIGACLARKVAHVSYFFDMHDGDKKRVNWSDDTWTITPVDATQHWSVSATVRDAYDDPDNYCTAMVDFNVSGKPNPPPFPMRASWFYASWLDTSPVQSKPTIEFADPSGHIVNVWVHSEEYDNLLV